MEWAGLRAPISDFFCKEAGRGKSGRWGDIVANKLDAKELDGIDMRSNIFTSQH